MIAEDLNTSFTRSRPSLYTFIVQNIKDKELASDILQDIYLRVVELLSEGKKIENMDSYLFMMVRNKIIDYWRKAASDKIAKQKFWQNIQNEQVAVLPSELSIDIDSLLQHIQNTLSQQQQTIFNLYCNVGLSLTEIAEKLNLTKSTVKQHLSLARKKINNVLIHYTTLALFFSFGVPM